MIIDSPIVSGSQLASGPFTQIGNVQITGSLSVTGTINGSITGSITSASYATNAELLDGLDSTSFVLTSSFDTYSGSVSTRETNLEATASVLTTASASFAVVSSSFATTSGSLSTRTTNLEATASVNTQASASFAAYSASVSTRLTTDEANITTLTNASSSFAAQSASLSTRITQDETNFTNLSSSFATTSGSLSTRVTNLESTSSTVSSSFASTSGSIAGRVTLIEGQYATTGSNNFTKPQQISDVSNAISFTSTASLYTDGGLRVKGAAYISGTAYFNDVVVYGTSSIEYITSSQLAIGTNIITLNTDTPSIRFGGISVFDSGSNNLSTGSLFWDSEKDKWIYSNPSASTYDGGMLISGPRNTSGLGNEVGTTSCALMMGQGGDHITSSAIFSYGNATCFYGQSFISSSGNACFGEAVTVGGNLSVGNSSTTSSITLTGTSIGGFSAGYIYWGKGNQTTAGLYLESPGTNIEVVTGYNERLALSTGTGLQVYTNNGSGTYTSRMLLNRDGVTCFACQVCAPAIVGGTVDGTIINSTSNAFRFSGNNAISLVSLNAQNVVKINAAGYWGTQLVGANDKGILIDNTGLVGIGLTNPSCYYANQLVVSAGSEGGITIANPSTTGAQYIMFADGTTGADRYRGYMSYNHTDNTMVFATDATTRFTITGTGIACFACQICTPAIYPGFVYTCTTTALNTSLSNTTLTVNQRYGDVTGGGDYQGGGIALMQNNGSDATWAGGVITATVGTTACTGGYPGGLAFWVKSANGATGTSGVNQAMRIDWSGRVGIGTATPTYRLTTAGSEGQIHHRVDSDGVGSNVHIRPNAGRCGWVSYTEDGVADRWGIGIKNGDGNLYFSSGNVTAGGGTTRAIIASSGVVCFACTICSGGSIARKGFDYHTVGQWYKVPFYMEKSTGTGTATTQCLIVINNNDSFQEMHFTIEYGSRLQGVSDAVTQTSLRTYGVNRFVGNTASVTDTNLITGGSGCAINTHAPMTVGIVGNCMTVVKVDFSSSIGGSSFVWGEVRIWSIEPLAGKITVSNNNY